MSEPDPKKLMVRNLKEEFDKIQTFQDKTADRITAFAGSMAFVYVHALLFSIWIIHNKTAGTSAFDPFPFNLLTLIVSLEAIFLSTFVMLSQNRQGKQADLRAELDYEVNVMAEKEIREIKDMLKELMSAHNLQAPKED